jgi:hypothetical protein
MIIEGPRIRFRRLAFDFAIVIQTRRDLSIP